MAILYRLYQTILDKPEYHVLLPIIQFGTQYTWWLFTTIQVSQDPIAQPFLALGMNGGMT